jgi:diguanylate cyclase (GGDEF)-like protein
MVKTNGGASHTKDVTLQSLLLAALLLVVLAVGAGFTVRETNQYAVQALECFRGGQEKLLTQVRRDVEADLYADQAQAIEALKRADASGSRHWFLYDSGGVLFERSETVTAEVSDMTLKQLADLWKIRGGERVDDFTDYMYEKRSGSLVFSKDAKEGPGLASVARFEVEGEPYYLGVFTLETYILESSGVNERVLHLRIFSAAASVALLIAGLALINRIRRHSKELGALRLDIEERTRQIEELSERLSSKVDTVEDVSIYDVLTGVYNKIFFDNLLARIQYDRVRPVSLMVVDINGLDRLNERVGYGAGDDLLKWTASLLEKFCITSDLIARTGSSEFSILMTNADEEQAYGTMENILRQFASTDTGGLTLSVGVAEMPESDERILPTMKQARKNLMLDKMLDPASDSYSTVNMLMEILVSFSKESVAQSNRMRHMAQEFGRELGFSAAEISRLALAAQLHDVGKIGIPMNILYKTGPLSPEEKELIKWHAEIGHSILKAIPNLEDVAEDILQHRERYDGTGYPQGLIDGQINLNARIINLLESYDAMTHERVYAKTRTGFEALEELTLQKGKQFDPYLVERYVAFMSAKMQAGQRKAL